ncbi:MAG: hypothetical protein QY332_13350 [Anaerolineales bacterium]|nr:MAG: hypothetical protein QY332_13350 [Anaerolineales bacterium]
MKSNKHQIMWPVLFLILASLACAERYFSSTQVYASEKVELNKGYNETKDQILVENVWVFKADGTFKAAISLNGQVKQLEGKYGGDDVGGNIFLFSIDTDNDGEYDDNLRVLNGDFSVIEWQQNGEILRYFQITLFP